MKRSTMRPAALALAGVLSLGLAACDDDVDGIETELNDEGQGSDIGGGDLQEDDFGTGDIDDGDAGGEDDGSN